MLAAGRTLCLAVGLAIAAPGVAAAEGVSPRDASPADKKAAQATYKEGAKHLKEGRLDAALEAYRASYDRVASPNSHLMIARVLVLQGELVRGYLELERVEDAARRLDYPEAAQAAAAERTELAKRVPLITVRPKGAPPGARILVGGEPLPEERWGKPTPVLPTAIEVTAVAPDGRTVQKHVALRGDATSEVELDLRAGSRPTVAPASAAVLPLSPVPEPEPVRGAGPVGYHAPSSRDDAGGAPLLPLAIGAGAVGLAGIGVFAALGAMSQSTYSDLEAQCPQGVCPPALEGDADAARGQQTAANVALVVGLVGITAGVTLFVADRRARSSEAATVTAGPGSIRVRGSF